MKKDTTAYLMAKKKINPYRLKKIYNYDYKNYRNYSYELSENKTLNNIRGEITFLYHALEKGMLHENIRYGYGKEKIERIINLIKYAKTANYDVNDERISTAVSVLMQYVDLHEKEDINVEYIKEFINSYNLLFDPSSGGLYEATKNQILENSKKDFRSLSSSRHSLRNFSNQLVSDDLIKEAVEIATKTPSVCNRQSWSVTVIKNKEILKKVMTIQSGINGMAKNLNTLIAVSTSYEYFGNIHERNQAFIDGGLFSMSLLYSLAYVGLGACALNANLRIDDEKIVKSMLNLTPADNIVMFIAVGHYPDKMKFPKSKRDSAKSIINTIK